MKRFVANNLVLNLDETNIIKLIKIRVEEIQQDATVCRCLFAAKLL